MDKRMFPQEKSALSWTIVWVQILRLGGFGKEDREPPTFVFVFCHLLMTWNNGIVRLPARLQNKNLWVFYALKTRKEKPETRFLREIFGTTFTPW
jgi:hypothetical protein